MELLLQADQLSFGQFFWVFSEICKEKGQTDLSQNHGFYSGLLFLFCFGMEIPLPVITFRSWMCEAIRRKQYKFESETVSPSMVMIPSDTSLCALAGLWKKKERKKNIQFSIMSDS